MRERDGSERTVTNAWTGRSGLSCPPELAKWKAGAFQWVSAVRGRHSPSVPISGIYILRTMWMGEVGKEPMAMCTEQADEEECGSGRVGGKWRQKEKERERESAKDLHCVIVYTAYSCHSAANNLLSALICTAEKRLLGKCESWQSKSLASLFIFI